MDGFDWESLYNEMNSQQNIGLLTEYERKINKDLELISRDFNKLFYFSDKKNNDKYKFEIKLDKDGTISILIFKGDTSINLDYQSTGFKWFMNFYIDLLCNSSFEKRDIIIIDEPGVHLHVDGIIELRKFLKEFAKKFGLTIIITTHSPFFIDIDNLDGIRFISTNMNSSVKISNKFHAIENEEIDTTLRLKKALTVNHNILFDYKSKIIFVEGVTDYNYLTAFKKISPNTEKYKNLFFIPINGLGKKNDKRIDDIQEIIKTVWNNKGIVLVDADFIGEKTITQNKLLYVVPISEKNDKYKTIESLFSKEDQVKFNIDNNKEYKSFENSSNFKKFINANDVSKETMKNFDELLDYLLTL